MRIILMKKVNHGCYGYRRYIFYFLCLIILAGPAPSADHYVTPPGGYGTNNPPYTNWADAATNIQWALNAAAAGETVWVTNGNYSLTNNIDIGSGVFLRSMNGRELTVLDGNNAVRCVYIHHTNAVLDGFTITRGLSGDAAGVYISGGIVRNCTIANNTGTNTSSTTWGGGVFMEGPAAGNCLLDNCVLISNQCTSSGFGGGIRIFAIGVVSNCTITCNSAGYGGGAAISYGGTIVNCLISSNGVVNYGGGIEHRGGGGTIVNCIISYNSAYQGGGAFFYYMAGALYQSCLLINNYATNRGGGVVSYGGNDFKNCTVVSNSCGGSGGGAVFAYTSSGTNMVENTIIYFNSATTYSNIYNYNESGFVDAIYTNCLTAPTNQIQAGSGNIEGNPQFVNYAGGDCRLTRPSPCINTGVNRNWMAGALDLDGHARIDRFSGIVDIGAYEYIPSGIMFYGK